MSTQTETGIDTRLFIGGAFVEAEGGRTFENRDPWSGDVVSEVASATGADAKRAIDAAAEAFPEWSRTPPAVRQGIFLKAADVLESRQDEVVAMLARETGCTFGFGMFQMHFVPGLFRQAAALAYAPLGEVIPADTGASPHVRRLIFTGSTATGRKLAEAAGRQLKRVVLELGGYNPLIVLADADMEYAVNATAFGAFLHQGQICMSARKIIVERPIADAFVERLAEKTKTLKAGDPKEPDTIIGPLINEHALATVKGRVDDAVAKGATVLAGGEAAGACYQATLLTDVP